MNDSRRILMKTLLIPVLACAVCSTAAIAGQPPASTANKQAQAAPNFAPTPQVPGAPAAAPPLKIEKNRIGASVGAGGVTYRASSADSIPPLVVQFSSTNQNVIQEWEEDLTVMTRLIEEALQRAADEDLTDLPVRLGIPITGLITGNRSVRPLYLEGFGALFMIKVNFPVVPPTKVDEEKTEHPESDWDKARHELYRRRQASWMAGNVESGADYDSEQVDTLKKELIQALKNG